MTIDKQQLQKLLWAEAASYRADCADWKRNTEALDEFLGEKTVGEVALELLVENERLAANVKLNLCDHPAIHRGDVDLLIAFVSGTSQIELAKVNGCTPPNISRKVRRVKARLGWREGMSVAEIRARAEQLRSLASQGAVVTADLMAERDQLKAENDFLRKLAGDTGQELRKASSWICREVEAGTESATHWAIRLREKADLIDAAMGKGELS